MKNAANWIDKIIEDLVDPNIRLSDTLLKVQVLAFKLQNQSLQDWVDSELNGYIGKAIPKYRKIPTSVFGNLLQDGGFNGMWSRNNNQLPIEYLESELRESLMTIKIQSKISEIEKMVADQGTYQYNLPHIICKEITKITKPWIVDAAWQHISNNLLEGILTTTKSTLLNFLLELDKELGDNKDLSIMKNKKEVDKIFEKTIGSITGENININIGNHNSQGVNYGKESNFNVSSGDKVNQTINDSFKNDLSDFVSFLNSHIDELELNNEDKEEILSEVQRVELQLKRKAPKLNIVSAALNTIHGLMLGVAGNAFTPAVLEKLGSLMEQL